MLGVMRGTAWLAAAVCLLGTAASGCRGRQAAPPAATQQATPPATPPAAAAPSAQVRTVNAKQIRALVDERKGKVVVVNFWASWCPPCMREFPAIIKVYEQYRGRGLDVIAVSMNSIEEMADIDEFVRTSKPPFPIFLADAQDTTFSADVVKGWSGEMPMTLVFNTAGERVLTHTSELTFEELARKVQPLLPPQ
jgi:thiol-disulfide isomerase/thioredoxin